MALTRCDDWKRFYEKLRAELAKIWPGAVVLEHVDDLDRRHFFSIVPPGRPVILVSGNERHFHGTGPFDVNFVTPDDAGIARVLAALQARIRVPAGIAQGAFDLRMGAW